MASTSRQSWVLMFGLFVAVCSRAWGDASDSPVEGIAASATSRASWERSRIHGTPDPPPPYRVVSAFPAVRFESPLDLAAVPGTNLLCVAEQGGKLKCLVDDPHTEKSFLLADLKAIRPELTALYAVTFHPQFETNRRMYVCYIIGNDLEDGTFVSEFTVDGAAEPQLIGDSERVIIRWWAGGHNGCCLKFGPDGMLYISTGDGGAPSPPDPLMAGQDVSNLLSCILRIDVDRPGSEQAYTVPADNPFVGMQDVRPEIWAFGFRNPWRMSFDPATGDLWVGDVGWQRWEMVYRVERGGNYGWPIMEGPQPAVPDAKRGPAPVLPPIMSHPHSEAASVTGGFVYRGEKFPELRGAYVYGDFQSGRLWGLRMDGAKVGWHAELAQTPLQLVGFAEDRDGELLLIDYQRSHQLYRLEVNEPVVADREFPKLLSETGLFENVQEQRPAAGVRPYGINAEKWSDRASSERWMAIPGTQPVHYRAPDQWEFPDGSVLAKTISLETLSHAQPVRTRIETQILHRESGTWRPYTYLWNAEQTDAELVPAAGAFRSVVMKDPHRPNEPLEMRWRVPARSECQMCHNPWVEHKTTIMGFQSASPLAFSFAQLNRGRESAESQLKTLLSEGWLDGYQPADCETGPAFADPYGQDPVDRRARSWLHVNCSHCHQPHAGGTALIELTFETPFEQMKLAEAKPTQGAFGIRNARLLVPGDAASSVLHYRIAKSGGGRMPRLGSDLVDVEGVQLIREWIESLKPETPANGVTSSQAVVDVQHLITELQTADSDAERRKVAGELLQTVEGAQAVFHWLVSHPESAVQPESDDARSVLLETALAQPKAEIRDLFDPWRSREAGVVRLGDAFDPQEVLSLKGNSDRGWELFRSASHVSCRNCHRIQDVGLEIGPELGPLARRYSREELLLHIMEPSRNIDAKYVTYVAELKSGEVQSGLLVSRSPEAIELKSITNTVQRIAVGDIEELVTQQKSLMPELILRDLTAQEAADLLGWLKSLGNNP